jgi:hypothetical protein
MDQAGLSFARVDGGAAEFADAGPGQDVNSPALCRVGHQQLHSLPIGWARAGAQQKRRRKGHGDAALEERRRVIWKRKRRVWCGGHWTERFADWRC